MVICSKVKKVALMVPFVPIVTMLSTKENDPKGSTRNPSSTSTEDRDVDVKKGSAVVLTLMMSVSDR